MEITIVGYLLLLLVIWILGYIQYGAEVATKALITTIGATAVVLLGVCLGFVFVQFFL